MCEETVFWDLNYCLHYTAIGTDQIKKKYKNPVLLLWILSLPETHTKRQATQYGSLPGLPGDGDKGIEIVYGEEKKLGLDRPEQQ